MYKKSTNKSNARKGVFDYLNIQTAIGSLALIFGITLYIQWRKKQNEEDPNDPANVNSITSALKPHTVSVSLWNSIVSSSDSLAHHLGTKYPSYDPRSWTENDKEVMKILRFQVKNFIHLEKIYFASSAPGRNLKNDVVKLLDSSELTELKSFYAKYGKTF
jgi:hypothetical protein